ncbi:NAD-dependent epimerase/dehydratase family protein [Mycolicibacterium rufum]|uniref:NAD-dependent epimerase/dehydratase family protein n=1 Tax=Mycolicibacterium rufum TaxID=318424 RepID=A0ABY3UCA2_9MYCO|nr:NAD-dependent epimerase/dehydratase family protein [Mycolicibacterium rufum]KGI66459.1 epimerase [Mycolicibacterium rufum]ULP37224.1 NAD-dependent epimerase/dehydratase family protein [Mycolicibacterium rufum]
MDQRRRILITGASGNVGAGVLRELARQEPDAELIGVCRRPPTHGTLYQAVQWCPVDLSAPDAAARLTAAMRDVDVVVHLALAVQPVDDEDYLYRANVVGTQAVLTAMAATGVHHLVYASSLGIYAPSGSTTPVPETWSTTGQATSTYSRHKVIVEGLLDEFERTHPDAIVARFRPTVVVQRHAAFEIRALYLGPLIPRAVLEVLRRRKLPVLPLPDGLALQFVHADDVGDAVVRLIRRRARGSFNIAADPLHVAALAGLVGARPVRVDPGWMRSAVVALHRLRVVAVTPGWYDVATRSPVMDTAKARDDLGWQPVRTSTDAARELIEGLANGATGTSPALGATDGAPTDTTTPVERVHDATLLAWCAMAAARARRRRRPGLLYGSVVAANLLAGTPAALDRVRERRRDPVAVLAPLAVGAAVLTSARGGWPSAATAAALGVLGIAERRRNDAHGMGEAQR